ncbi:MAG: hypothetical protein E7256_16075 [Lachnospiraceae bacterium]|nr:hypothetical protein [Lachnospiraceae bacterium]
MKRKVVSIEIGEFKTRICELQNNKKRPTLLKCVTINTPEHMVEDGYIRDKTGFADYLKEELAREEISHQNIIFTINSGKILSREVIIPLVKSKNIRSVVDAEVNQYFPMDISDYAIQYSVIEQLQEQKQMRLMVYAAPNNMVRNYFNLAELLGGTITALDFKGNALYQWIKNNIKTNTNLVLQVNEHNTLVTIVKKGVLQLQRTVNYGIENMVYSLAENPYCRNESTAGIYNIIKKIDLSKDFIYIEDESVLSEEEKKRQSIHKDLTEMLQIFIGNITRVVEYYSNRNNQSLVEEVTILGQEVQFQGFEKVVQNAFGITTNIVRQAEEAKSFNKAEQEPCLTSEYIPCIGALYAPLDFRIAQEEKKEEQKSFYKQYIGLTAATALACGVLIFSARSEYKDAQKANEEMKAEIASLSYLDELKFEYEANQAAYEELKSMHDSTYSSNENLNDLISQMEEKFPSTAVITSFNATSDQFSLGVIVPDKKTAEKFLLVLKEISYIGEVNISGLSESEGGETGNKEVSFSIQCTYAMPDGIQADQNAEGVTE